jgi:long-chain-fatty-acid--CoA ligase ACSBG
VGKTMPDGLKKSLVTWAKRVMLTSQTNQQVGGSGASPFGISIARKLLMKAKQAIGLDQCKFFLSGAAPISTQTLEYFASIGISINEVYGMSECCGATTLSTDAAHRWGSIGFSMAGCETRVFTQASSSSSMVESKFAPAGSARPTEEEQGEICFRGRHIMMGYLMNPSLGDEHKAEMLKKNQETIDADGWLHSGDKASRDTHNMFKITGRYKELIIGAGGENIAPVPIEAGLKRAHAAISNCVMVGDKRKFNIVLVTLKAVGATGERPGGNDLEKVSMEHCGAGVTTISQAMDDPTLIKSIEAAIKQTNKDGSVCPSQASMIQKFSILPIDLSVETGDITPSLKLKRSELEAKYSKLLDRIYSADNEKANYVRYTAADTAHLTLNPAH